MAKKKEKPVELHSDQFLRDHGFRIGHRPDDAAPIWVRDGLEFTHAIATWIAEAERNEALSKLEGKQEGG